MKSKPDHGVLAESARPLPALVFVGPLLAVYELGMLQGGGAAIRNGADVWLRRVLDGIGFGQYFLLPLLTCGLLLGWHHIQRHPWQLRVATLGQMATETLFFATLLIVLGQALTNWIAPLQMNPPLHSVADSPWACHLLSFVGAGIYEEVLFRLLLIPSIALVLIRCGESTRIAWWAAALASSLLFAAAHYRVFTGAGDTFTASTFLFRTLAGFVFAALFITRGFGITVGAHFAYDLLVGYSIS